MKRHVVSAAMALALATAPLPLTAQDAALVRARALLARITLIDAQNDLPWTLREAFATDLTRGDLRTRGQAALRDRAIS